MLLVCIFVNQKPSRKIKIWPSVKTKTLNSFSSGRVFLLLSV